MLTRRGLLGMGVAAGSLLMLPGLGRVSAATAPGGGPFVRRSLKTATADDYAHSVPRSA